MDKYDIIIVFTICVVTGFVCFFFGIFYTINDYEKSPKAIDVYRGKTTLEITYRDSVAVDSVVVYKVR